MVMSCHGGLELYDYSPHQAKTLAGLPSVFRRATAVQCVSATERAAAVKFGLDPARATIIPCGVDTERFHPSEASSSDEFRIVSVGWLRWLKGYEFALLTLRALLDRGVPARLDLFGGDPVPAVREPSDRGRIRQAIDDLGLGNRVVLHGHTSSSRLVEHYRQADVLLHSSVSEGLPVVILEAMACGLPVVASDAGGVREAITDGIEGFVVPVRDPAAAATALAQLWHKPALRVSMGLTGRDRVRREFSLERQLRRL
jgi:glycosyltransferase involved in cell wall biosynthesis